MRVKEAWAAYFSPTGTTRSITTLLARETARALGCAYQARDFTLPEGRREALVFPPDSLVILGVPVYAGRVPNVLLSYLGTLDGEGALAVPMVLFGNRHYDNALTELRDIMEAGGLYTLAAGAFVGAHAFSPTLGQGRPDTLDEALAHRFGRAIAGKAAGMPAGERGRPIEVPGVPKPYGGYYQPRDSQGSPIDIRKAKPLTSSACTGCGLCARMCPMGSIAMDDPRVYTGICIKCGACVKGCPAQAKDYDDPGYLFHKAELEETCLVRKEPEIFI